METDLEKAVNNFKESYKKLGATEFEISAFQIGYLQAKEYLYTKQDLIDLVESLKNYTKESHTILGHDDREPIEFVDIFVNEISDEEALSLVKEINKQPMTCSQFTISDEVLFEQATVAMEEHYGYGSETEIDAYFRGAKWMQKQFKQQD
jgi:hypothetical protein